MFMDNWFTLVVCVLTIGDIHDCQDTYTKVRVFSYFFRYIWSCEYNFYQFVTGHIKPREKSGRTQG